MNTIIIKLCSRPGQDAKLFRAYTLADVTLGVQLSSTAEPAAIGARACAVKTFLKYVEPKADRDELETRIAMKKIGGFWEATLQPKSACDHTHPFANCSWISTAMSMPDSDTTVLVYSPAGAEPVWLGYHDGENWVCVEGGNYETEVTHWMDLPEPPSV